MFTLNSQDERKPVRLFLSMRVADQCLALMESIWIPGQAGNDSRGRHLPSLCPPRHFRARPVISASPRHSCPLGHFHLICHSRAGGNPCLQPPNRYKINSSLCTTDKGYRHFSCRTPSIPLRVATLPPLIKATLVSFGFVFIHPFTDGNGRLHSRLRPGLRAH